MSFIMGIGQKSKKRGNIGNRMEQNQKTLTQRFNARINLWITFIEEHKHNADVLTRVVHDAHLLVYYSIRDLANSCDTSLALLNDISVEFDIAKATRSFDIVVLEDIEATMTRILDYVEDNETRSRGIAEGLQESHVMVENEESNLKAGSKEVSQKMFFRGTGAGLVVGALGGPLVKALCHVAWSYTACTVTGLLGGGSFLAKITDLVNQYKKKDSDELSKTMQKLNSKMNDLKREFVVLELEMNRMPSEIRNYAASVERCIRYATPDNPEARAQRIRVKKMSKRMLLSTDALKEKFEQIGDMARSVEWELESMLLEHEPPQLLPHQNEAAARLLDQ
ncbi:uncharacterized protein EV154DRAFT_479144 [Mucor mucedo]|uniref:uncharacterized protein n=1 Tax=Mucor mucedo TaxID=29922 RepID=UPI00221FC999|nr:uncharacterized protein EV154DRAFT_479144 [Mucor mucedo]KAI7893618.1 hypothetical protein EV154DRAFT_479144 [Mucor mucedo]